MSADVEADVRTYALAARRSTRARRLARERARKQALRDGAPAVVAAMTRTWGTRRHPDPSVVRQDARIDRCHECGAWRWDRSCRVCRVQVGRVAA
jgi:hypothetical protein